MSRHNHTGLQPLVVSRERDGDVLLGLIGVAVVAMLVQF